MFFCSILMFCHAGWTFIMTDERVKDVDSYAHETIVCDEHTVLKVVCDLSIICDLYVHEHVTYSFTSPFLPHYIDATDHVV